MVDPDLIEAYRDAKYIVRIDDKEHRLHVGKTCRAVELLLEKYGRTSVFFISPENPFSEQLSESENALRHSQFIKTLNKNASVFFEGFGTDENETWPREKSYLILSDDESEMTSLAHSFGQNAMLKNERGNIVELLVLF